MEVVFYLYCMVSTGQSFHPSHLPGFRSISLSVHFISCSLHFLGNEKESIFFHLVFWPKFLDSSILNKILFFDDGIHFYSPIFNESRTLLVFLTRKFRSFSFLNTWVVLVSFSVFCGRPKNWVCFLSIVGRGGKSCIWIVFWANLTWQILLKHEHAFVFIFSTNTSYIKHDTFNKI